MSPSRERTIHIHLTDGTKFNMQRPEAEPPLELTVGETQSKQNKRSNVDKHEYSPDS